MASNNTNSSTADFTLPPLAPISDIIAYSAVYGLISLTALVGNTLVCYVILRNPEMRTVTNAFLLNLAVADLLFTAISVPALMAVQISPNYWVLGEVMCKAVPFLNTVTLMASIYTLVALAFDRYNAIVHPFRARKIHTRRRTVLVIALIWALSVAVSSPQIPTMVLSPRCQENWINFGGEPVKKTYRVAVFVVFFVIPIVIITIAYTAIMRQMRNTADFSDTMRAGSEMKSRISRTKRKTTMMMLVVIIIFLICMLPFNILLLIINFLPRTYVVPNIFDINLALNILKVPVVLASACNPIIYNFFSVKFKIAFADVFKCRERQKSHLKRTEMLSSVIVSRL